MGLSDLRDSQHARTQHHLRFRVDRERGGTGIAAARLGRFLLVTGGAGAGVGALTDGCGLLLLLPGHKGATQSAEPGK